MVEADLEILEAYLDDALSDQELAQVALRLSREPELTVELEEMRHQRVLRREVFASMEPTEATTQRMLGRVDESLRRRTSWEKQLRWGGWGAAAAACLLFGFTTGWWGRGGQPATQNMGAVTAGSGGLIGAMPQRNNNGYDVRLYDNAGRVVAVQHFESLEKAREFTEDMKNWQDRQRQMQNGNVVPTGGKF